MNSFRPYHKTFARNGVEVAKVILLICILGISWSFWNEWTTNLRRLSKILDYRNETLFNEEFPVRGWKRIENFRRAIVTAKGIASYAEIERNVFRPNNYLIEEPSYPIPKLRFIKKPSCAKIFRDWLKIAKDSNRPSSPPRQIEESQKDAFLLNGYSKLYRPYYVDSRSIPTKSKVWNITKDMVDFSKTNTTPYQEDGLSIRYAFNHYPLKGMKGIVIGTESPWVEIFALESGAERIVTIEYRDAQFVGTDKLTRIHPIKFAEDWNLYENKFDFAISFSSIEHSGLGRYGDPIDAIGDLREVMKTLCTLKKGGLFFIGLPCSQDGIYYNAHRTYGRMRLAMIMTGFEWLSTYQGRSPRPHQHTRVELDYHDDLSHDLFVLRKL